MATHSNHTISSILPTTTISSLPNECLTQILSWIDDTNILGNVRRLNQHFCRLATPLKFAFVNFEGDRINSFPTHLYQYVRGMKLDKSTCPYRGAWAVHHRSEMLKSIRVALSSDLIIFRSLGLCRNLEELDLVLLRLPLRMNVMMDKVYGTKQDRPCWKKVRRLSVQFFFRMSIIKRFTVLDNLSPFFPILEELKLENVDELEFTLLPKSIRKLELGFSDRRNEVHQYRNLILNLLNHWPLLNTLRISGEFHRLILPESRVFNITDLSVRAILDDRSLDQLDMLSTWCKCFPRLKRLNLDLHSYASSADELKIGNIDTTSVIDLVSLKLTLSKGPRLCNLLRAFPALAELDLHYEYGCYDRDINADEVIPLGDFSMITKLSLNPHALQGYVNDFSWFRMSVCTSYRNLRNRGMHFSYVHDRKDAKSVLTHLAGISEVVETLCLKSCNFPPIFLDLVSSNLKELLLEDCTVETDLPKSLRRPNVTYSMWKEAVERLRKKGVKLKANNVTFN